MATDLERLIVSLEASTVKYERAMQRAMGLTNSATRRIEQRFAGMNASVNAQLGGIGKAFLAGVSLQGAERLLDASVRIQNSLKVTGLAGEDLTRVYDALFASAQRNAAPLEALVQLYGRASLSAKELGVTQAQLLDFTDKVSVALRVSGQSAEESSGALLQLSQLLGSGTVRAEEFNSVQEGALPILQAVAAGLKEAGGSVAALRSLVIDGKVSSAAFFAAFEAGSSVLTDKVAGAELTVSQSFVRLQNILIDVAGKFNDSTGASGFLAHSLDDLGTDIQNLAGFLNGLVGPMQTFLGGLQSGIDKANEFAAAVAHATGGEQIGFRAATMLNDRGFGANASTAAGRVLEQTFAITGETQSDQSLLDQLSGKAPPKPVEVTVTGGSPAPKPVSLSDYPISGAGTSSGMGKSDVERHDDAVKDLIADLRFEGDQLGRTSEEQEVYANLHRAGADAASDEGKQIAALTRLNYEHQQSLDQIAEAYGAVRDVAADAMGTFVSDLREGKSASEALADSLSRVADRLVELAINNLIDGALGASPASGASTGIGTALAGLFGGKRANGGSVSAGRAYVVGENRPEVFVPGQSGMIIPRLPQSGGGGQVTIHQNLSFAGVVTQGDVIRLADAAAQRAGAQTFNAVKKATPGWQVQMRKTGRP